ncbi:MAG TPA: alkaline phosphatase family protein [Baekduia sp.]
MADPDLGALTDVQHIVVVMMENRSFDHMLGYLGLLGTLDVEGLRPEFYNLDRDGNKIPVHAFDADASDVTRHGEALRKALDPDHSVHGVATQLGAGYDGHRHPDGHNGGFVRAFVETRKEEDDVARDLWSVPMGYYTNKDLPAYDFLARHFCVCDHWHSSVPGDTWPNRQFSLAGQEGEKVQLKLIDWIRDHLHIDAGFAKNAPIYDVPAFTRHLRDDQWRWYSHDPATLRAVDGRYRDFTGPKRDNFAFFDRRTVSAVTEGAEALIVGADSFLDDAANGKLRDVSWIDPNFIDLHVLDPNSNDDHPPSDIRAGQEFILQIYEALSRGPQWQDTLLVIYYDEHGGFYDHVEPPAVVGDPGSKYRTYGVRVPALLVGPRVPAAPCHTLFDHTSLIKSILLRFAGDAPGALAAMPERVRNATHIGGALGGGGPRTDIPEPAVVRDAIEAWHTAAREKRQATTSEGGEPAPSVAADGAGQPLILHDFQRDFVSIVQALRGAGLPPGQP